jgi:antitoxin (DNA-binding transcriptional repressor) of toxin-antitoxin stability system
MQYGLAQAKARLSELTTLVDLGEEVVIAKHGRPSYKLILMARKQVLSSKHPPGWVIWPALLRKRAVNRGCLPGLKILSPSCGKQRVTKRVD